MRNGGTAYVKLVWLTSETLLICSPSAIFFFPFGFLSVGGLGVGVVVHIVSTFYPIANVVVFGFSGNFLARLTNYIMNEA